MRDRYPTWPWPVATVILFGLIAIIPFLFVDLPPLVDAIGHLGQYAVQTAPSSSPLNKYFEFYWALRLNLACDLVVQVLKQVVSLDTALWSISAAIPVLTVAGIMAMSAAVNNGRAALASWSFPFSYSYPFLYGFLNFTFTLSLSLLFFAAWCAMDGRRRAREAIFWIVVPVLMIGHAVGGGLLVVMVATRSLALAFPSIKSVQDSRRLYWLWLEVRPLLGVVPLVIWQVLQGGGGGSTVFDFGGKFSGLALGLRDQYHWFDIGCMVAIILAPIFGWLLGARYSRANAAVVLSLVLLYIVMPSELSGVYFTDTRILPALLIAVLTLQDWATVSHRTARIFAFIGFSLFIIRITITSGSFIQYNKDLSAERSALVHVERGRSVLALVTRYCKASKSWRMNRNDHLPALATADREAWVNAHWDNGDVHLLKIKFRPDRNFYDDPSQYVWRQDCIDDQDLPITYEDWLNRRRTIADVMPDLPISKVDYLWLIDAKIPNGVWNQQLHLIWSRDNSALYKVKKVN